MYTLFNVFSDASSFVHTFTAPESTSTNGLKLSMDTGIYFMFLTFLTFKYFFKAIL